MPLQTTSDPAPSTRLRTRRLLVAILAFPVLMYGGAAAWLVSQETRLVFQAERPLAANRPDFPHEQVDIPRVDGARQFAWVMKRPEQDAPWVLFLHGNGATIASRTNIAHYGSLRGLGLHVLAAEYRGFGGLDGVPTERALIADAGAAYRYLREVLGAPADRIVIYGWSLGSAVAVALAADAPAAAVVLEGAPASLVAIGRQQYPWFPIGLLMRNPFHSIERIDRIRAPLLFLHSPDDAVVPIAEARRLYAAALAPKSFVEVRGGHVYASEVDRGVFYGAIERFLAQHGVLVGRTPAAGAVQ